MRKYIDAHVHITPPTVRGKVVERFDTELLDYGFLRMEDGGFQTMPPYMHDSQFDADTLVHLMDVYGVEKAVIMQSLMSQQNEAIAAAVNKYPARLAGAMVIEPDDHWQEEIDKWTEKGLSVIKFEMRSMTHPNAYPDLRYDSKSMMRIFEYAEKKGLTVTIDPAPVDFPVYEPEKLDIAVKAFPKLHFVLCHMAYPRPIDTKEYREKWERMLSVSANANCWLDVCAMPDMFDEEGWPYPTALQLLKLAKDTAGAGKLVWGTDITGTLNRATYPQMMKMFERTDCLSEQELELLFYDNAKAAYSL